MNTQELRQSFAPVLEHLNSVGSAVLAVDIDHRKIAPNAHCLLDYKRKATTLTGWPIVGDCDFQIEYATETGDWNLYGTAFGQPFTGNDPRAAAAKVTANLNATRNCVSAILERSQWYLSRYAKDASMFSHRLSVELAATAEVEATDFGCRVTALAAPEVVVNFYKDSRGTLAFFAFDSMTADQRMAATAEVMFRVRTETASFVNDAMRFLMRMAQLIPQPGVAAQAMKRVIKP